MVKNIFTVLLGIACVVVLYLGNSYWSQHNQASVKATESSEEKEVVKKGETKVTDVTDGTILANTKNWPAVAVERFEQTQKENKAFKILFVGSSAMGSESEGTYPLVKEKLIDTYGEENLDVAIKTFDTTTGQFIENDLQMEIASENADLIILEPFVLLDNDQVGNSETLDNVMEIMDEIHALTPEANIMIQPPYPLYNAVHYPLAVDELKVFADENSIPYLDHWNAWPDTKDYLDGNSVPNEKGIQAWSDFLLNYFISDESESN